jgi:hypothetical protein
MTRKEIKAWQKAARIAATAMGKERRGPGRHTDERRLEASLDPLAWWCLTESIMSIRDDMR